MAFAARAAKERANAQRPIDHDMLTGGCSEKAVSARGAKGLVVVVQLACEEGVKIRARLEQV